MGGPTPPYARTAADISDSSISGRSALTGTAAQGATALGLGTGDAPSLAGLIIGGGGPFTAGAFYSDPNWGLIIRPRVPGVLGSFLVTSSDGSTRLLTLKDSGNFGIGTDAPTSRLTVAGTFNATGTATFGSAMQLASYTVATVPTGAAGAVIYVSNGRKVGEAAGSGTGVIAYFSNGAWRRLSDDSAVAA